MGVGGGACEAGTGVGVGGGAWEAGTGVGVGGGACEAGTGVGVGDGAWEAGTGVGVGAGDAGTGVGVGSAMQEAIPLSDGISLPETEISSLHSDFRVGQESHWPIGIAFPYRNCGRTPPSDL